MPVNVARGAASAAKHSKTVVTAGVDWGGTWIRVALVRDRAILHRVRTLRPDTLQDQCQAIVDGVNACTRAVGLEPQAVGVGIAGIIQGPDLMTAINIGVFGRTPLSARLSSQTGIPVHLVNDVQAVAGTLIGRWPEELVALISMGTGIGGAVLDHGALVVGNGAAGDFGHMVLSLDGPACPCGGHGCVEALVSGRLLSQVAVDLATSGASIPLQRDYAARGQLHAGDLDRVAGAGDIAAREALDAAAAAFAAGLRSVTAALDPSRIVLIGTLLNDTTTFGRLVRLRWTDIRPKWSPIQLEHLPGDQDAALIGAAVLAASRSQPERPADTNTQPQT